MLSEILQNLITLWGGKDSYPTEEKINQNLKLLRNEQWFHPLFSEHIELFLENKDLRFFIGAAKLHIILSNPKKKLRFEEDLIHFINLIRKKHK
ncbi:hypothetical protein OKW24_005668 [Peribacillus simplex]|uniref:hypothetical protein n=1 Tax=Peribacillus simplex TaxID=1478 RepID=UPI0024E1F399|nr:hypothetical protein [Peribacillus simplex]MDF9763772.1 hypothetical protein [Peribacillus simplex]